MRTRTAPQTPPGEILGGTDRLRRGADAREPQAGPGSWWQSAAIGQPADEAERNRASPAPQPKVHSWDRSGVAQAAGGRSPKRTGWSAIGLVRRGRYSAPRRP